MNIKFRIRFLKKFKLRYSEERCAQVYFLCFYVGNKKQKKQKYSKSKNYKDMKLFKIYLYFRQ